MVPGCIAVAANSTCLAVPHTAHPHSVAQLQVDRIINFKQGTVVGKINRLRRHIPAS